MKLYTFSCHITLLPDFVAHHRGWVLCWRCPVRCPRMETIQADMQAMVPPNLELTIIKHPQTSLACLFRMETLTWINKMFLFYFCMDSVFGTIDTYFLFKLYRER